MDIIVLVVIIVVIALMFLYLVGSAIYSRRTKNNKTSWKPGDDEVISINTAEDNPSNEMKTAKNEKLDNRC